MLQLKPENPVKHVKQKSDKGVLFLLFYCDVLICLNQDSSVLLKQWQVHFLLENADIDKWRPLSAILWYNQKIEGDDEVIC